MLSKMVSLHCVVLGVALLTAPVYGGFRTDYVYNEEAEGWFKLHLTPLTWDLADLQCHFEGSVLASPLFESTQQVMTSLISNNLKHDGAFVHIGVSNRYSDNEYVSVEGLSLYEMSVQKDKVFYEDYSVSEHCMRMNSEGEIVAGSCTDALPYICYNTNNNIINQTECGTIDKAYSQDLRTGQCYKFHNYGMSWRQAYMVCAAEGGYLAIINSDEEANVLMELFAKYPDGSGFGTKNPDAIHIGIIDYHGSGVWRTLHGESLNEAGYARWSSSAPSADYDKYPGTLCGGMMRSGLLFDFYRCEDRSAFICEKHVLHLADNV